MLKLCADSAMQIDVDDALRGHVFAVQDALFWVSFIVAITVPRRSFPTTVALPRWSLFGSGLYLLGLLAHTRRRPARPADGRSLAGGKDGGCRGRWWPTCAPKATTSTSWWRRLPADRWADPTPAPGWTIAHQIGHLLWTDRVSLLSVTDEAGFADALAAATADPAGFVDAAAEEAGGHAAGRTAQRLASAPAVGCTTALLTVTDGRKLPWFGPPMSATSMATARLMETWAHGLDVADALGVKRPATDRLRSIAHLGVRTRDYAFFVNNLAPPTEPFLVELRGPGGDTWSWGPRGRRATRHRLRRGLLLPGHPAARARHPRRHRGRPRRPALADYRAGLRRPARPWAMSAPKTPEC